MKNISFNLLILLVIFLSASCSQDEDFFYQDQPRVRIEGPSIWTLDTDSLEYSFLTNPNDTVHMDATLYIMGTSADHDRIANIEVVTSKTTASSDLYVVPSQVTVPANATKTLCTIILKRGEILKTKGVRLYVKVNTSSDFQVGAIEQDHLILKWNDLLSKPKNWSTLSEYFGTYSDTKYRFIIQILGTSEYDTNDWALMMNYKMVLTSALNEYNANHPGTPLTDENGVLVTF